jgi:hypothetical protein
LRDQLPALRAVETAVAGKALSIRGLYLKESFAFDGQIERIAGGGERALAQVKVVATQQSEVVNHMAQLRVQGVRTQQHGAEELTLGAVAWGLRVGKVGSCSIERLGARYQSRHRRIVSAVHCFPLPFAEEQCSRKTGKEELGLEHDQN